ncbi:MAG: hypothetical protein HOU81_25270 [Hamadaea sp.]|uniref:hypothetical protein n=1 Tax=Hamadaea sp. TaxID=2024425 RepID=UPI00179DFD08|nr:hypothetical protein [Hamadaea sp.]NUR74133.1 hypothetical protein [Hamadaea sp.]NUT20331.1 hypothetical protein [Hamadaea sp.]
MVRDAFAPPAAFVAYVESRLPLLLREVRRYVPDERIADQAARDLLASVAIRWPWYARLPGATRKDPAKAADKVLRRGFADVVKEYADPQREIRLSLADSDPQEDLRPVPLPDEPPRRSRLTGSLSPADEAQFIWERSAQTVRRRTVIVGGLALMGLILAVSRPRPDDSPADQSPESPSPESSTVPSGIDILLPLAELSRLPVRSSPLPAEIDFEKASVSLPKGRRARGVFSATEESAVLLLDDGRLYAIPDLRVRPDNPGVMSPDGRYIAFRDARQMLYDVSTGVIQILDKVTTVSPPIWLDHQHLLYSAVGGSQVVRADGQLTDLLQAVDLSDVVAPQGYTDPMTGDPILRSTELLAIGRPLTAPARVRRYTANKTEPIDVSLQGELVPWVGLWRGLGFSLATGPNPADRGRLVRRCQTPGHVPAQFGEVISGTAAVRAATGAVLRVLVETMKTEADRVEPVGWLDASTVLISANGDRATVIVAWGIESGKLELVTVVNRNVRLALADLSHLTAR